MNEDLSLYCSRTTFNVARVLSALLVFCCHLFQTFNNLTQFLIVSVFFFFSGYGMEKTGSSARSLLRLPRYICAFFFLSVFYYLVYCEWFFPSAWFLLAYFVVMVFYRFFSRSLVLLVLSFVVFSLFYIYFEFAYCYYVSVFAFFYGVFVFRYSYLKSWYCSFPFFLLALTAYCFNFAYLLIFSIPFYVRLLLKFSSISSLAFLSCFAPYVYPFFLSHCFVLGLFGVTWTLGGSFDLFYACLGFLLSSFLAFLLYRFLPFFSKRKFWIFN